MKPPQRRGLAGLVILLGKGNPVGLRTELNGMRTTDTHELGNKADELQTGAEAHPLLVFPLTVWAVWRSTVLGGVERSLSCDVTDQQ